MQVSLPRGGAKNEINEIKLNKWVCVGLRDLLHAPSVLSAWAGCHSSLQDWRCGGAPGCSQNLAGAAQTFLGLPGVGTASGAVAGTLLLWFQPGDGFKLAEWHLKAVPG